MVSVIIPTVGEGGQFLKNLLPVLKKEPDVEIIVVDNLSTDNTAQICKMHGAKHIINDVSMPFAISCNIGTYYAHGEYYLFLNNDTVPNPGFLQQFVETYTRPSLQENGQVGIVGAKLVFMHNPAMIQCAGHAFYHDGYAYEYGAKRDAAEPEFNELRELNSTIGACLFVSRDLFHLVGGFWEGYRNGWEDVDFCLRVREMGYKVIYNPEIVIKHVHMGSDKWGEGRIKTDPFNTYLYRLHWLRDGRVFKIIGQ